MSILYYITCHDIYTADECIWNWEEDVPCQLIDLFLVWFKVAGILRSRLISEYLLHKKVSAAFVLLVWRAANGCLCDTCVSKLNPYSLPPSFKSLSFPSVYENRSRIKSITVQDIFPASKSKMERGEEHLTILSRSANDPSGYYLDLKKFTKAVIKI